MPAAAAATRVTSATPWLVGRGVVLPATRGSQLRRRQKMELREDVQHRGVVSTRLVSADAKVGRVKDDPVSHSVELLGLSTDIILRSSQRKRCDHVVGHGLNHAGEVPPSKRLTNRPG